MKSIYLAGPDVFLPDGDKVLQRKADLTRDAGFLPVYAGVFEYPTLPGRYQTGLAISAVNELLLKGSDMLIANLTPFRGIFADTGTVFELGFMSALGRPVFAYTNDCRTHLDRVNTHYGQSAASDPHGTLRGPDETMVEDHDMIDNLMIDGAIHHRRGSMTIGKYGSDAFNNDLTSFKECLGGLMDWLENNN
ncbi:MAG: nucleoside 2-deoxyribosyltransferase [Paracoccaceae bacterium]